MSITGYEERRKMYGILIRNKKKHNKQKKKTKLKVTILIDLSCKETVMKQSCSKTMKMNQSL